jgi:hypothetical protein
VDFPTEELPTVSWLDAATVTVTVRAVRQITKALDEVSGVRVKYEIEREQYPRALWIEETRQIRCFALAITSIPLIAGAALWIAYSRSVRQSVERSAEADLSRTHSSNDPREL